LILRQGYKLPEGQVKTKRTRAKQGAAVVLLLACISALPTQARWESKNDNKSLSELGQMKDWELCQEAQAVCVAAAIAGQAGEGGAADGVAYLTTIASVVRDRHHGHAPEWLEQMGQAVATKEWHLCPYALCVQLRHEHEQSKLGRQSGRPQ
jgi:hypothetical protein